MNSFERVILNRQILRLTPYEHLRRRTEIEPTDIEIDKCLVVDENVTYQ